MPGNLAGFPLFLFYFPLAFLLVAALSLLFPFPVAFKLATTAGTFGLPIAALAALRWIGCPFPIPALGAILTLPFLLNAGNSMWGGNIPSTLAGEFAHSLSLTLLVLFLGALYRGIHRERDVAWCAILFALVSLAHGYGMVLAVGTALYFLIVEPECRSKLAFLLRVYAIGALVLGFWMLPLLAYLHYTTGFAIAWKFASPLEVAPVVLWPTLALGSATIIWGFRTPASDREWRHRIHFLAFPVVLSVALYVAAPRLNLVDVRFLASAQLFLTPLAAIGLGRLLTRLQFRWRLLVPPLISVIAIAWIVPQQSFIPDWIRWNYEGMERKPWWRYYIALSTLALRGGPHSPRVVYEHSVLHDRVGTVRAFEALPLFSGRPTLEGAYFQSSPSSPFIFYIQSELTETPSCPFPPYRCGRFDPGAAIPRLALFNVKEVIAVTDTLNTSLASHPGYRLESVIGPYKIYQVLQGSGRYVVPLRYRPAVVVGADWKRLAYEWFQRSDWLDVPILFLRPGDPVPPETVPFRGLEQRLVNKAFPEECQVTEVVTNERVQFETECPGRPHLIKISYHPKWRVEGADRVYLVSPSFMLVYPQARQVRLVFGDRWPDSVGRAATGIGIVWLSLEVLAFPLLRRYSESASGGSGQDEMRGSGT